MANLDAYYQKWEQTLKSFDADGERVPEQDAASGVPKIDPKDISCHVGKPLTEEEFKNRNVGGAKPHVLRQR